MNLKSWKKVLGHLHFFAENRPSSISPSPLPLSMLYQWAESALFRSNIDQGGGGTSLCANATLQSVEKRAISEHVSYFQAVPRTFVQDCSNQLSKSAYIPGTYLSTISAPGKWMLPTSYRGWKSWTWRETSTGFQGHRYCNWATSRLWKEWACHNTVRTVPCARWRQMTSIFRAREATGSAHQVIGGGMMKSTTAGRWTSLNSGSGPRASSQITYARLISIHSPSSQHYMTSS